MTYHERLQRRIDEVHADISSSLATIDQLDPKIGIDVLTELVRSACQATNDAGIGAAQNEIRKIPAAFLRVNLPIAALSSLDLNDEWDYRRLLELLRAVQPSLMPQFVASGASSSDPGVRVAASEFAAGGS